MGLMKRPGLMYWMIVNGLSGSVVFTLLWMIFFVLGFAGLPMPANPLYFVFVIIPMYVVVPAVLMGVALGFAQGLTLFEEWRCRLRWTLISTVGMLAAVTYFVFTHDWVFGGSITVVHFFISGAAVGLIVAAVQWLELRRSIEIGFLHWVLFNTIVWGLSSAIGWLFAWVIGGGALLVVCLLYAAGLYGIRSLMDE